MYAGVWSSSPFFSRRFTAAVEELRTASDDMDMTGCKPAKLNTLLTVAAATGGIRLG
jgi:hypothetical protein